MVGTLQDKVYTQMESEGDRAMKLENKRWLEKSADKIRSGEMEIKERGPSEYRPSFDKRFY